ncbi:hypothetical protein [Oceanicoccus sp. KOV_DT_Chl]|uniref:hypothetical protein n=1 Tax=Oceanicoccus sp. KOV_DT_Chl TaxID=1904639 RepID=UPI000C7BC8B5|nr:hypothetical protein [Oceanicoccus sp. KOV_DT_Chl]
MTLVSRFCFYPLLFCTLFISDVSADELRRELLTPAFLLEATVMEQPVQMTAFSSSVTSTASAVTNPQPVHWRFSLADKTQAKMRVLRDDYGFTEKSSQKVSRLPIIEMNFIQSGADLIPVERKAIASDHPHWEYIVGPGRIWNEQADGEFSRAAIPFSLRERNANCTHNGVMSFLFKPDGTTSNMAFQVVSETCLYLKFDFWGLANITLEPTVIADADQVISRYRQEVANRLPIKTIDQLVLDYPALGAGVIAASGKINPADMTLFGLVIDDTHYVGGCQTRYGVYPYCDVLDLPSYSLAKSVFAGLGLMYLEKHYPGSSELLIADFVPACKANAAWKGVTFNNALDMATGNYQSAKSSKDEGSKTMRAKFFVPETHSEKIDYICQQMPRKAAPGTRWVYHTADTYLLSTAISQFLKEKNGEQADFFNDVFLALWRPLQLSPVTEMTSRSYDATAQPFAGYGLTMHRDDIARMASTMNNRASYLNKLLDQTMWDSAMQRLPEDRGLAALDGDFRYSNGFWAYNVQSVTACKKTLWLPLMSGYGGISVVMMPNDTVYYYFSDGGAFSWLDAAIASNSQRSYCH